MTTVGEFTYAIGFSKPDTKYLELAEQQARENAKKQAEAYKQAAKAVETAEERLYNARRAGNKEEARAAEDALRAARKHIKATQEALRAAESTARGTSDMLREAGKAGEAAAKRTSEAWKKTRQFLVGDMPSLPTNIIGTGLKTMVGALSGATVAAAGLVERWTAHTDEMAKTAKKLDVPIEQYQRLTFAAERSGVAKDTLINALKDSNKLINEARSNEDHPTAKVLKAIGLEAEQLAKLEPEERLGALADALMNIQDPGMRAAAQLKIFGEESGVHMTTLLAEGSDGIRALGDHLEDLGGVISTDAAARAEEFRDKLTNMQASMGGVAVEIGAALLPSFEEAIGKTEDWVAANQEFLKQDLPNAITAVTNAMGGLVAKTAEGVSQIDELGTELRHIYEDNAWWLDPLAGAGSAVADHAAAGAASMVDSLPFVAAIKAYTGRNDHADIGTTNQREADFLNPEARNRQEQERARRATEQAQRDAQGFAAADIAGVQAAGDQASAAFALGAARARDDTSGALKKALDTRSAGGGGGENAKKKKELAALQKQLLAGDLGAELGRLADKFGAGQPAVDSAAEAAAQSLQAGATQAVARKAALEKLGGLTGQDLAPKASKDPLLSAIFGNDVPDVELSSLAQGAEPQVLISTINNTFNFENHQQIDGTSDPGSVASASVEQIKTFFEATVSKATKTVKLPWAR